MPYTRSNMRSRHNSQRSTNLGKLTVSFVMPSPNVILTENVVVLCPSTSTTVITLYLLVTAATRTSGLSWYDAALTLADDNKLKFRYASFTPKNNKISQLDSFKFTSLKQKFQTFLG